MKNKLLALLLCASNAVHCAPVFNSNEPTVTELVDYAIEFIAIRVPGLADEVLVGIGTELQAVVDRYSLGDFMDLVDTIAQGLATVQLPSPESPEYVAPNNTVTAARGKKSALDEDVLVLGESACDVLTPYELGSLQDYQASRL